MTPKEEAWYTRLSYSIAPKNLVTKNLWVGRYPDEVEPNIKFILCLAEEGVHYPLHPGQKAIAKSFPDRNQIPNPKLLHALADRVNLERSRHPVLVHCWLGVNRACFITCLALIKEGMTPIDAIALVRKKRTKYALPNRVFREWLLAGAPID